MSQVEYAEEKPAVSRYDEAMEALSSLITKRSRADKSNKGDRFDILYDYLRMLELEEPIKKMKVIHVAGTKGKGSTCAFSESILRNCGFHTPHLIDIVRERFRLDGADICEEKFLKGSTRLESLLEGYQLFRGNKPSDTVFAEDLLLGEKKIFVFLGHHKHAYKNLPYRYFDYEYGRMKGRAEVVFIEWRKPQPEGEDEDQFADMPWYVYPRFAPLADKLLKSVVHESLVGFGEDGCVCSMEELYLVWKIL